MVNTTVKEVVPVRDKTPYDELDPSVVKLCRELNRLPGIWTIGSCGGHEGGGQSEEEIEAGAEDRGELPADQWRVTFKLELGARRRPRRTGWLSMEFVAWVIYNMGDGGMVDLNVSALPPFLNHPGKMAKFEIRGWRGDDGGIEPDDVAEFIVKIRKMLEQGDPPERSKR